MKNLYNKNQTLITFNLLASVVSIFVALLASLVMSHAAMAATSPIELSDKDRARFTYPKSQADCYLVDDYVFRSHANGGYCEKPLSKITQKDKDNLKNFENPTSQKHCDYKYGYKFVSKSNRGICEKIITQKEIDKIFEEYRRFLNPTSQSDCNYKSEYRFVNRPDRGVCEKIVSQEEIEMTLRNSNKPQINTETGMSGDECKTIILPCNKSKGESSKIEDSALWVTLRMVINILTAGISILAFAGIVYGAILYTTAGGSPEQVKKAYSAFTNVAIGILAYAMMWALLQWLIPGGYIGG